MLKSLLRRPLQWVLQTAGRAYVPGWELADAQVFAEALAAEGTACTLGYFNAPNDPVPLAAARTAAIIDAVATLRPAGYVSLKAPAFGYDIVAMAPLLDQARRRGVLAHFDSHDIGGADATLQAVAWAARRAPGAAAAGAAPPAPARPPAVGLTVPGRWLRSPADADQAAALGVRVRVVKGEWPDPDAPRADARAGFLAVVDQLAGRAAEAAIATHDPALAREALRRLLAAGTRCELELLHGLPRRAVQAVALELGVPVRLYIPFGAPWRPYALRKLGENPRIAAWLLHDLLSGAWQQARGRTRRRGAR